MSFTENINDMVEQNRNGLLGARKSWRRVRLNEVVSILNGYPFESSKFTGDEGTPLIRIRNILSGNTDTYYDGKFDPSFMVKPGEFIIGMDGDFQSGMWGGPPALLNQRVCKITPDETKLSKKFFQYVLPGYLAAIHEQTSATTVKHLSSKTISEIPFPLPKLEEQLTIVDELEKQFTRLEAGTSALQKVRAELKRYRSAVLKAACEGKLFENNAAKFQKVPLGKLGKWCGGGTPSKFNKDFWANGDIPWISPKDMKKEFIDDSEDHITKEAIKKSATNLVPKGTVLIVTRSGILKHTLPIGIAVRPVTLNQDLKALQPDSEFNSRYIALALRGSQQQILQGCTKAGTTVDNIEFQTFLRYEISVPSTEQARIVSEVERRLGAVDAMETVIEGNLKRARRLRQAVLQRAFAGDLGTQEGDTGNLVRFPVVYSELGRPGPGYARYPEDEIAAGDFNLPQLGQTTNRWIKIEFRGDLTDDMFVADVVGDSMEPEVPRSSRALFKACSMPDESGIYIFQKQEDGDSEEGGRLNLKRCKKVGAKVVLIPSNLNYSPREYDENSGLRCVAKFVQTVA